MNTKLEKNELDILNEIVNAKSSVMMTDVEGNFVFVNDNFCELSEYTREELLGKPAKIFKSGIHSQEFYKALWDTLLAGKTWNGLICNKTKTGKLIWLDTTIAPSFDSKHEIINFIGVRLNVTEDIANKRIVQNQEKQLELASKMATIGEISGYVAHEINNPLTIMTFALNSLDSALASPTLDLAKIQKLCSKMGIVTNRIAKIVLAMRNFSRSDTSMMEPNSLHEILDDVLLFTEDIARSESIDLIIENEVEHGLLIECHKNQISQVMINLIKNACDAVRTEKRKEIKLKIDIVSNILEIKILDSGKKIPEEIANCLFTPYYTTKKEGSGTGIGLTISQKIIEAHGGNIFLDKNHEQTCFVVKIPRRQMAKRPFNLTGISA